LLQSLTGFLQSFLTGARQEKQRGEKSNDQEGRNRNVPAAQSVERLP